MTAQEFDEDAKKNEEKYKNLLDGLRLESNFLNYMVSFSRLLCILVAANEIILLCIK